MVMLQVIANTLLNHQLYVFLQTFYFSSLFI